ncbi:metallophosphoesterase [Salibacterium salarium]|uniref:Phosphoesterase n=1 Tax=Salibacterium salarium TaxID=284579 RepID=A0A3R9QKT5_9BACI|nr:metallophosphoesterase [Salibacterium salarium]RSL32592.1 metallophosphoesterase [Salibacterium salarium]
MKCLIISDSHGSEDELQEVIERHRSTVDAIFHCGDSELKHSSPILHDTYPVQGNVDIPGEFPEDRAEDVKGTRVYITHGHLYNIKMTHVPLSYRAEEKGARMALFGHSHVPTAFEDNGVIFVNPGSLMQPRSRPEQTYALAFFEANGEAQIRFLERKSGEELIDLRQSFPANE